MCDPIIGTALAIGSQVVGFISDRQQADAQAQAAYQNEIRQQELLRLQAEQLTDQKQGDDLDMVRQAMQNRATARVAAGEAGLQGAILMALEQEQRMDSAIAQGRSQQNYENDMRQNRAQAESQFLSTQSELNSINRPSFFDLALGVGGTLAADTTVQKKLGFGGSKPTTLKIGSRASSVSTNAPGVY